jgi:presqualene diphosphate synthase
MITLGRFIAGSDLIDRRDPAPTISPTEEIAIAQRIRSANPSLFWSTLLLPAPRRNAMQALYLLCHELRGIADGNASRTLKLALLTDWRTEIGSLYAGRPQHFVARALSDAVERFDLRCVDFLTIIEGMETEARTDIRAPSLEQLYLYCKQRSVAVVAIALRILGAAQADADQVAAALGRGMVLTGILRDLTQDARRHRLYLPRELLRAQGVFATTPSYVLAQPALPQVCNALAEWAADWFADCRGRPRRPIKVADGSGHSNSLRLSQSAPGVARPWLETPRRAGSPSGLVPPSARHRTRSHHSLTLQTAVLSPPRCHPMHHRPSTPFTAGEPLKFSTQE